MKSKVILSIAAVVALGFCIFASGCLSTVNAEVDLRTQIEAKVEDNMSRKDKLNKTILQAAQISQKEVEALKDIIVGATEARGSNPDGGDGNVISLAAVREAVPSISSIETLKNLQNIISGEREQWAQRQTELLSLSQQRNAMIEKPISGFILGAFGNNEDIEIVIISSTQVKKEFETGVDDNVSLFGDDKPEAE